MKNMNITLIKRIFPFILIYSFINNLNIKVLLITYLEYFIYIIENFVFVLEILFKELTGFNDIVEETINTSINFTNYDINDSNIKYMFLIISGIFLIIGIYS
jgi:hypothetical protein